MFFPQTLQIFVKCTFLVFQNYERSVCKIKILFYYIPINGRKIVIDVQLILIADINNVKLNADTVVTGVAVMAVKLLIPNAHVCSH